MSPQGFKARVGSLSTIRNEVAKDMFLQVCVCPQEGGWWYPSMPCRWYPSMPCSRSPGGGCAIPACIAGGIPACLATGLQGGAWFGVPGQGGCLVYRGLLLGGQGLLWGAGIPACTEADTSLGRDGYFCGRYASHWNAFLFAL